MNRLFITVNNISEVLTAGYTVIRVYTDTDEDGAFSTLDGTATLVSGTESYIYTDSDGTSDLWYKTAFYGAGPGEGTKGSARKGETAAAYATVEEMRNAINKSGATSDVEIAIILDAVKQAIDRFCNRPDGFVASPTATARLYVGTGSTYQRTDEFAALSSVAVKDSPSDTTYTAWAATDYIAASGSVKKPSFNRTPYNLLIVSAVGDFNTFTSGTYTGRRGFPPKPMQRGVPTVQVTARWGYALTVPPLIKEAAIAQGSRWYKRSESAWADAAANNEVGQLDFRTSVMSTLDPDIRFMLTGGRFVRPTIGRTT